MEIQFVVKMSFLENRLHQKKTFMDIQWYIYTEFKTTFMLLT